MKLTAINSGNFTEAGNFSGYNAQGLRIHCPARLMESLNLSAAVDITFPVFALADEKTYPASDKADETETFTRLTACSLFLTQADAISARNADAKLEILADADLRVTAKTAGLTPADIAKMATASPF